MERAFQVVSEMGKDSGSEGAQPAGEAEGEGEGEGEGERGGGAGGAADCTIAGAPSNTLPELSSSPRSMGTTSLGEDA